MANKPGPTHDFPKGKLNDEDEGGLKIAISIQDSVVRIDFGEPTAWIGLPVEEALAFASLIVGKAIELRARSP